jgi:hypothetical protein
MKFRREPRGSISTTGLPSFTFYSTNVRYRWSTLTKVQRYSIALTNSCDLSSPFVVRQKAIASCNSMT